MSSAAAAAPAEGAPPKKKGKMKGILMMLIMAIVFVGGGVGAGIYAAGAGLVGGKHEKEAPVDPNAPKLVEKEGAESSSDGEKQTLPMGLDTDKSPDPTKYKATYYTFEQPFTANLRDSDGFVQVGLGAATFYDAKVLDNLKDNDMPIRSAVLMVLSQQDSFSIASPDGKLKLQKDLKDAINGVLKQRTGFGGIDNVYFTSMVIQ